MMGKDFTLHWSAFNNIQDWTPDDATQAGNQLLDQEQGEIQTIIGLDYAVIFQERAIRRAIYVGPPIKWDFGQEAVEKRRGCISRNAAAVWGRSVFYAADDGFYMFDGQASTPIGYGKVDDYFVSNLNYAYRHKVCCAVDGINKLFVVGFPVGGATNISELLIFSLQDGRWTHDVMDLEYLFDSPVEALTVDSFHSLFPADNLDAAAITPDDIELGGLRRRAPPAGGRAQQPPAGVLHRQQSAGDHRDGRVRAAAGTARAGDGGLAAGRFPASRRVGLAGLSPRVARRRAHLHQPHGHEPGRVLPAAHGCPVHARTAADCSGGSLAAGRRAQLYGAADGRALRWGSIDVGRTRRGRTSRSSIAGRRTS